MCNVYQITLVFQTLKKILIVIFPPSPSPFSTAGLAAYYAAAAASGNPFAAAAAAAAAVASGATPPSPLLPHLNELWGHFGHPNVNPLAQGRNDPFGFNTG